MEGNGTNHAQNIPWILSFLANTPLSSIIMSIIIGVPSAILYLIQIIMIFKHNKNKLNSSFLTLCAARGIASLLGYAFSFLYQRFPRLGLFLPFYLMLPSFCLMFIYFLVNYILLVEYFVTAVLSLDRLIAIAFPFEYEQQRWEKALIFLILATFILPFTFFWRIFELEEFVHIQEDGTFTIDTRNREIDNSGKICFISAIVFTTICLCINFVSMAVLRCSKSNSMGMDQQNGAQKRIQRKMTIYALVTFLGQYIYSFYLILLYIVVFEIERWGIDPNLAQFSFLVIFNQLPWVYDLCFICMPAWLLLWAHKLLRIQIRSMFKCKYSIQIATIKSGIKQAWTK